MVLSRVVLTGWGAMTAGVPALEAFTDRGRFWATFTASSNLLELKHRPSGTVYANGTVTAGVVTLAAAGASGISGTAECTNGTQGTNPTLNSTSQLIVSYAHENDLIDQYAGVASYLDSNSKWYAQSATRFEPILRTAKRQLDELIASRLGGKMRRDTAGRRMLADIADPRQLAPIHALYTLSLIEAHRAGMSPNRMELARDHMDRALSLLKATEIVLDYESDARVDVEASVSTGFIVRG